MAAWSSTNKYIDAYDSVKNPDKAIGKFLRFLITGDGPNRPHAGPFGHAHLMLLFEDVPQRIHVQLLRHRTWNWSWFSHRYVDSLLRFIRPVPRKQVGRIGDYEYEEITGWKANVGLAVYGTSCAIASWAYRILRKLTWSREQASFVVPMGVYVNGFGTVSLRNCLNFLVLRDDTHAQGEAQEIARQIYEIVKTHFPLTVQVWEEMGRPVL